ncbi:DDE superfamily endonuclease [Rhizobium sp. ERR 922]|nr:DDE superfamily endonuclease [Rhizobium sp. ERR 922]TWB90769.1 DDE superfamily endonuclease [Rhizobium sp. ERR 942]
MTSVEHRSQGLNNRAENSHLPLRKRERMMQGFRSAGGLQRFISVFSAVRNLFVSPHQTRSARAIHLIGSARSRSGRPQPASAKQRDITTITATGFQRPPLPRAWRRERSQQIRLRVCRRVSPSRMYNGALITTRPTGDEFGSRVIASRMVGNIMRLAMLIERRYAPYPKWFGTAFSRLACASDLAPLLEQVLVAQSWQTRESALVEACRFMAELQIQRGVPGAVAPTMGSLNDRPYRFVDTLKIFDAIHAAIEEDDLRPLPEFGAADQFLSSNFVLAVLAYASAATGALLDTALGTQAGRATTETKEKARG